MCSYMSNETIDMDLVNDIVMAIPENDWDRVKETLVEHFVDNMPSDILCQLTGDLEGYSQAETILTEYYEPDYQRIELIVDSFRIIGPNQTVYVLDLLDLDIMLKDEEDAIESDLKALS